MTPIVFMLCLTLHNIEEALWLCEWQEINMPNSRRSPKQQSFLFAVLGITALGYLSSALYLFYPKNTIFELIFIGFVGAMLINALIPHLFFSIKFRNYCPGVLTGCLLMIPFNSITLYNATASSMSVNSIIIATLSVSVLLLISIAVFEKIAKKAFKKQI